MSDFEDSGMQPGEWYTPTELRELPNMAIGHADTQVGATDFQGVGGQRVWYGRTEDSPAVSVETLNDRHLWDVTYEGDPARIRINFNDEVDVDE